MSSQFIITFSLTQRQRGLSFPYQIRLATERRASLHPTSHLPPSSRPPLVAIVARVAAARVKESGKKANHRSR